MNQSNQQKNNLDGKLYCCVVLCRVNPIGIATRIV